MPKGLLLLILILLAGGYFIFGGGGGASQEHLPFLQLNALTTKGEKGYMVGAEGKLELKEEKEYNIVGSVYVKVSGVKVKEARISSLIKGPSTLPLSIAPVSVDGDEVAVGVDLNISFDGKIMPLRMEVPVTLPPREALLQRPSVSVGLSSFEAVEGGYDVELQLGFYNPNPFSVDIKNAVLRVGGNDYPLNVGTLEGKTQKELKVPLTVDANVIRGKVSGSVVWNGTKQDFDASFSLSLPRVPIPEPRFYFDVNVRSLSSEGVDLNVSVTLENPSTVPSSIGLVEVKAVKGDVEQKKELGRNITLGPLEKKTLSTAFTSLPFLVGGELELYIDGNKVSSVPLEMVPSNFIDPPEINVWIEELNQGGQILHVLVTNPNDFNLDVESLDVVGNYSGTDIINVEPTSFVLQTEKEITLGSETEPLSLAPGTWIVVTYSYGIKRLEYLVSEKHAFLYNG